MRVLAGTFVQREPAWAAATRLRLAIPDLGRVAPGHYLLVKQTNRRDPLLARPFLPCAQEPGGELVDVLDWSPRGDEAPDAWHEGDALWVLGPAGRPFEIDHRTRRALLIGLEEGLGPLLLLTRALLERGIEVTFVSRQHDGAAMPAAALPPEVEYVLAPSETASGERPLAEHAEQLITWADQLFIALPAAQVSPLINVLRRRLLRLRKGFAQALVMPTLLPCAVGACDLCTMPLREGNRRLCRDGLVFDLLSFA